MEAFENYQKQSWRNRCRILTAGGPQNLNVPVVHENGTFSLPIRQIKVDYSTPWTVRTERAIESAYSSSPFFIYYRDDLFSILDSRPVTLWELNRRLIDYFCSRIGIAPQIMETSSWEVPSQDLRHPRLRGGTASAVGPSARGLEALAGEAVSEGASQEMEENDYREIIHPKRANTILRDMGLGRPYWQVFKEKFGFVEGLSVMDLLFNEGPESICWLKK